MSQHYTIHHRAHNNKSSSPSMAPLQANVSMPAPAGVQQAAAGTRQAPTAQRMMLHPQMGKVKGPGEDQGGDDREEVPYPIYIRPYDDELPQVSWKKNAKDPFGTLKITRGENTMVVKVPIKDDRILPRLSYPTEILAFLVFVGIAVVVWKVL